MSRDDRSQGQKIRDAFLLHAIFVEGVRNWQASLFKPTAAAIAASIRKILADMRINFKDATKKYIAKLVRLIRAAMAAELTHYNGLLQDQLHTFLGKDVNVFQFILSSLTGISYNGAAKSLTWQSVYGTNAANGTNDGNASLWASITKVPMSANGLTIPQTISAFANYAIARVLKAVNVAYADNADTDTLERTLFEAGENGEKAVIDSISSAAASIGATSFAFVSAQANQAVSSVYYGQYQWCSVMDSRTTIVCQSRNNNVYRYNQGPLPPAHENCRSTVIPYENDNDNGDDTQSFTQWVAGLAPEVQADAFSKSALDAKQVNPNDAKPLSVDDFDSMKSAMLQ